MFHACVQRFDGMDEKILGGKLNRALEGTASSPIRYRAISELMHRFAHIWAAATWSASAPNAVGQPPPAKVDPDQCREETRRSTQ